MILFLLSYFIKTNMDQRLANFELIPFNYEPILSDMKKLLFLAGLLFFKTALAQPTCEGLPYSVLYGDDVIYDLNQRPLLESLRQELEDSDLLGNLPSFKLFVDSFEPQSYPNGNQLVSFQIAPYSTQGIQNIFYENGNLFTTIPFKNNLKSGTQKVYYNNGTLFAEIPYTSDEIDGELITYHSDGNVKMKQSFNHNVPVNTGKMFHSNGNVQLIQAYQNGLINGTQIQYYINGIIQSIIPYSNGVINGTVRLYYPDSTLLAEIDYLNGKVVSNKCFTPVGQISKLNAIGIYQLENGIRPIGCSYQRENIIM